MHDEKLQPQGQARVPERVLVVDDDPAIRFLVRENLEPHGFTVDDAADGAAGLEAFAARRPDILLLDILMPGMDGFEVCARLRELSEARSVPILVLTALEDTESIEKAYGLGATDFATKPLNWSILPHRVRYLVRANQAMERALVNEARLAEAQRLAHVGSWEWDIDADRLIWSDEVYRIFGVEPEAFSGKIEGFLRYVHEQDLTAVEDAVDAALRGTGEYAIDHRIRRPDGEICHVQERAEILFDGDQRPLRMIGTVQDITERQLAEERIRHLAFYDDLTGLPNRVFFQDQLRRALAVADREQRSVVVVLLDLDHFRRVNDALGHGAGDLLLKQIAVALRSCLRSSDYVARLLSSDEDPFARIGGDEFALMLPSVQEPGLISRAASRINACLSQGFRVAGRDLTISASLGIATYPRDGADVDTLIKNADTALFRAKEGGRGQFRFFSREMHETDMDHLALEEDLRRALQRDELVLHYQPQLDLRTDEFTGAEALIRWNSPDRGLVYPNDFIPIAEQFGLIGRIGEWVLRETCRQAAQWRASGAPPLRLAVNLSGQQLRDPQFPTAVATELSRHDLGPMSIEMELTETSIMHMVDSTFAALDALKELGIPLAVDDFGTGYSSLSYLRRLPVDVLKIDRSFVEGIGENSDSTAIVSAVTSMAHSLNLRVIAEGVETQSQLDYLRSIGCDMVQGYLTGRPMPAEQFRALLKPAGSDRSNCLPHPQ